VEQRETSKIEEKPGCPLAAKLNHGLFQPNNTSPAKGEFQDTILLVSCNDAYYDMLENWEFMAKELGLRWAVLALDDKLYNKLGPERAISPGHAFSVSGQQKFRRGEFNKLSCNKMRMVMKVAEECEMDVVFSDVDNVFFHNPFEHDFGRLIQSKRYEYIYQTNGAAPSEPLKHACLRGEFSSEGNTGFYYAHRNSTVIRKVIDSTLKECAKPDNEIDDQSLFWHEFHKVRKGAETSSQPMHHCNVAEYLEPSTQNIEAKDLSAFNYCCLDPYYYPIGIPFPPQNKDPITFHANFVSGHRRKVERLRGARADGFGWDENRTTTKLFGVL
ncbi:MAG: hypothetical protein SGARI_002958, partial [Bacillariaceae sp.]